MKRKRLQEDPQKVEKYTNSSPFIHKQWIFTKQLHIALLSLTQTTWSKGQKRDRWGLKTHISLHASDSPSCCEATALSGLTDQSFHHHFALEVHDLVAVQSFTLLHTCKTSTGLRLAHCAQRGNTTEEETPWGVFETASYILHASHTACSMTDHDHAIPSRYTTQAGYPECISHKLAAITILGNSKRGRLFRCILGISSQSVFTYSILLSC